ncbi:HAD family hydrolase [Kineococcus sp. SYSU DK006]|uniref:HAD family hydrolase n=1 Tax=Kineococcus sp. SYSU DK006 TaxID=3383127 RepID=UPI003D7D2089
MSVKAVIFDMDGVLVDAREWHYEALNAALGHFGLAISRFDHLVTYDGLPTRTKLEMLSVEQGLPTGLHPFINNLKQQFTMETVARECRPTFAHEYALNRLRQDGYRLAVASNSIRPTIEAMLSRARLLPLFEVVTSADDVVRGKPDPEIYCKTLRSLDLDPADVLVVEDNDKGIAAARAAGCRVLPVSDPSGVTHERIAAAIREMSEVPA